MSSPYDEQIEELLGQYRDAREQAVETRQQINKVEATVTAPRKVVKVTVGAQGQVTELDFPTAAYRNLAPKELSKVILTAIEQARAQALSKVSEAALGGMLGGMLGGISPADLLQGRFDPRSVLPEDLDLPDAVRAYVDRGIGVTEDGGRRDR
ncbi:YbaB/EbfC family nucleoid-associated protein [Streptomyces sp. NPDC005573]|uniref:YbaB/EbfC family nucleoid-associated protein n=1 Tax=Streptomyces sp. NPDC005573 TaxID=3156890 RepID=UPI00339F5DD3